MTDDPWSIRKKKRKKNLKMKIYLFRTLKLVEENMGEREQVWNSKLRRWNGWKYGGENLGVKIGFGYWRIRLWSK